MVLLIIPGICLYFFIGSMLSKIAKASGDDSDLDDIAWLMFWPVIILMFIAISIIYIFYSVGIWISEFSRRINKLHKLHKLRNKKGE